MIGAEIVKKNENRVFSIIIKEKQLINLEKNTKINKNIKVSKKNYNFYVN